VRRAIWKIEGLDHPRHAPDDVYIVLFQVGFVDLFFALERGDEMRRTGR